MPTNFHLAPPVKIVDGLIAVPIDIQSISGSLIFDGATQISTADITINFIMNAQNGCPIFDLRQTINAAWLDGVSIAPQLLAHHDFGGGPQAELRVVAQTLAADSNHSLRVQYNLVIPQASNAGSYQPNIAWNAGPRLTFNFGFTDLGPGRYLEAWVPANLIFDQFTVDLEIEVLNTAIAHAVISNAQITSLSSNKWRLHWPDTSSALSTLLEVRAADTVTSLTDIVNLPISGTTVTIETWKLTSGSANLATQMANIKNFLTDNEDNVGAYVHNNRFVVFFNVGGMEYDGGTTTDTGALRHEIFHSWFGRGVKPASQPDGWWDEAWTEYNMAGAAGSTPFNFSSAPVSLATRNPWSRITPNSSYSAGETFFENLASLSSAPQLNSFMDTFYQEWKGKLASSAELEAHLLKKIGKAEVVDGFHRFIYGLSDPVPLPDLWLRDDPAHAGANAWGGAFWDSPDLWIRNADDDGLTHQNPEYGQDNWIYARLRNRGMGTAAHFALSFNTKSFASMEFFYPHDFLPATAAVCDFDLAPSSMRIFKARWPSALVPTTDTHPCLLAAAITRGDHPTTGVHVWEHNNLAQKNLTVVNLNPGDWIVIPFVIVNIMRDLVPWFELVVVRPKGFDHIASELLHSEPQLFESFPFRSNSLRSRFAQIPRNIKFEDMLECGGNSQKLGEKKRSNYMPWTSQNLNARNALRFSDSQKRAFATGALARQRLALPYGEQLRMGWRIQVPYDTKQGECLKLHLMKRNWLGCKAHGGIAVEIHVQSKK